MIFLPEAGNRTIVSSFVWTQHRNVMNRTDGRTDGQTELLWLLHRSALRAMRTRCKNYTTYKWTVLKSSSLNRNVYDFE